MNYIKLTKPNEGWTTDAWHRRIYMHLLSMDFWKVSFPRILYIHWKDNTKYMNVGDPWKPQAGYIMLHLLIELPFWQIFVALFRALSQWNHGFYRNSFQLYPFFTIPFLVFFILGLVSKPPWKNWFIPSHPRYILLRWMLETADGLAANPSVKAGPSRWPSPTGNGSCSATKRGGLTCFNQRTWG